MNQKAVTKAM